MEYVESTQLNKISLESKMLYCENLTKSIYIALFYYGLFHGGFTCRKCIIFRE